VSSTFSDMKKERNALQEEVFPRLRRLCLDRGTRFQAIDLRWGVSEEAGLDQRTMRICIAELERCRDLWRPLRLGAASRGRARGRVRTRNRVC